MGSLKTIFFTTITFFGGNVLNVNVLKCVSINNKACRAEVININSNEPLFYPNSILVNKCSSSCNNINYPFATLCVPDVVKDINVKVFNLMSRSNGTRYIGWYKTCRSKYRLHASECLK